MRPRCLGLGRRSLLAGTAVRRRRRTRGLSFLSCVRISMMPAELAWRTCSCPYSAECVEKLFGKSEGVHSTRSHESEKVDEKCPYRHFALPKTRNPDPSSY